MTVSRHILYIYTKTIFIRGRESRASSEATVCLMSINAAPTFIFNLCVDTTAS